MFNKESIKDIGLSDVMKLTNIENNIEDAIRLLLFLSDMDLLTGKTGENGTHIRWSRPVFALSP